MPDSKYDLIANTYTAKEQSFAVCEVGDAKQPDVFYPQVKIMRWDNEVNFSARLVHEETSPEVALVADKIQWIGGAVEAHFYEIGEGKEGGGFEFEIILKEPPKSNVINMTLQTKGLDFLYQPQLTPEEVAHGANCPENVVGSYAVYHKTMAGDFTALGGKNYKAGKAFHIFRPRIEDVDGNWVWGVLNIDEKAGLLTVAIPQDFLDKAVYPVRHAAGLEFGYHTQGGSWDETYNPYTPVTEKYQVTSGGGVLQKLTAYIKYGTTNDRYARMGIYLDSSGPTTLLDGDATGILPTTPTGNWDDSASLSEEITNNTYYWLALAATSDASNHIGFAYDSGGTGRYTNGGGDGTLKNPFPTSAYSGAKYSIYATYTPAGAAGQATAKRFGGIPHMALNKGVW